ncbi:hypothetical protein J7E93_07380 [Streptomyces sp. ISL-36]|uniref:hypothetical protein n=1 Tax=Streptomyces sp. ISL-36 TaxID=2819182 RepID=UPI001BE7A498|nr:hypothetical protein [Streptomyces sp. ISL-36]MBT2439945.1 hypothetical protein [Streptomyces sp. ISL-36]
MAIPHMIPYTHWAYFTDEETALRCAQDLPDFVTRISETVHPDYARLLLAGRDVDVEFLEERHQEVQAIVTRNGGHYDGGEATYLDGVPLADPTLLGGTP